MKKRAHLVGRSHVRCRGMAMWRELVNGVTCLRAHISFAFHKMQGIS